jgi:DNA-binding transcriptional LysR family regulator
MVTDEGPTLHQLRCFVAVAETGQFTAAGERLGLAQPSLSAQIARLEEVLGVDLFHRTHRPVALTDAGQALEPLARRALAAAGDVMRAVAEVEGLRRGHVTIGATPSLGATLLPRVLARFHARHPEIAVTVLERHSDDLAEQLEVGALDLALAILPMRRGGLEHAVLFVEELVVMMPAGHPLATRGPLRLEDLRDEPFVMLREGYNVRAVTVGAFERAGIAPRVTLDGAEIASVHAYVAAGLGCAIVPGIAAALAPDIAVVALAAPRLERAVGLVRPAGRPPSRSTRALSAEVRACLVEERWFEEVGVRLAPEVVGRDEREDPEGVPSMGSGSGRVDEELAWR